MLAIEVEFLTGRYAASAHDDRQRHEWPPHPARLFSALVAEWGCVDEPDPHERRVLELIEALGPPQVRASDAVQRSVVTHYVPVNDPTVIGPRPNDRAVKLEQAFAVLADPASTPKQRATAERSIAKERNVEAVVSGQPNQSNPMPSARVRQARFYPSVRPDDPVVAYIWPSAELSTDDSERLDGLVARVTRIGHSASLVSCRLTGEPGEPSFLPHSDGQLAMRTVSAGQLQALEAEYARHQGSRPRSLPASITRYAPVANVTSEAAEVLVPSTAGELIVFEVRSSSRAARRPSARDVVQLTTALRGAVMHHAVQVPEVLSGHRADGSVTDLPHAAFVALPDVGYEHAHGDVLGVGVLLPKDVGAADRRAVLAAIGRWESASDEGPALTVEGGRLWGVTRQTDRPALVGLRTSTWSCRSNRWVSATPVALPWRSGRARRGVSEWDLADEWVAKACTHVGLPEPIDVGVALAPLLVGATPAGRYPAFRQGGIARRLVHVSLEFASPVQGPLVLGSGRFRGLGLMRPIHDTAGAR